MRLQRARWPDVHTASRGGVHSDPRLPGPLAGHLDSMLAGGASSGGIGGMLGGLTGGLGGGQAAEGQQPSETSPAAAAQSALGGLFGK